MRTALLLLAGLLFGAATAAGASSPPNIVFILVDDWGTYDASFRMRELGRTPQFYTPHIDELLQESVRLDNYYVQPICTPTRSQLLSGRYQIHTGLQHKIIQTGQPNGIPLNMTLLPEVLKSRYNYSTHMLGKWHVGFFKDEYCPWSRGFDTFLGYLTGAEFYDTKVCANGVGLDFRNSSIPCNTTLSKEYSTELYSAAAEEIIEQHNASKPLFLYMAHQAVHMPMQATEYWKQNYTGSIREISRLTMAGMVSAMDSAVGNLTQALKAKGIYNNTIIVISNDNGGLSQGYGASCSPLPSPSTCGGLNYPYRGYKSSYWEGGVRGTGMIRIPELAGSSYRYQGLFHVSDWYPTLVSAAAASQRQRDDVVREMGLDGVDQWQSLIHGQSTSLYDGPRTEILHNIDPLFEAAENYTTLGNSILRYMDWKLIIGRPSEAAYSSDCLCDLDAGGGIECTDCDLPPAQVEWMGWPVRLYNITGDLKESHDLAAENKDLVDQLIAKVQQYNATAVPVYYPPRDPESAPSKHGGIISPWQ